MKRIGLFAKRTVMCMIFVLMLVGCNQESESTKAPTATQGADETSTPTPTEAPKHEHAFTAWEVNHKNHWYVCECGEKAGMEEHDTNGGYNCSVCNAWSYSYDDGTGAVYLYDERRNPVYIACYDENGEVISDERFENEYDEDGYLKTVHRYCDGILFFKSIYALTEQEGVLVAYEAEGYSYYPNGNYDRTEWDEDGDTLKKVSYDAEGNAVTTEIYEYECDEEGNNVRTSIYVDSVLDYELHFAVDEDGCTYISREVRYDENGEIEEEINYDPAGNVIE